MILRASVLTDKTQSGTQSMDSQITAKWSGSGLNMLGFQFFFLGGGGRMCGEADLEVFSTDDLQQVLKHQETLWMAGGKQALHRYF